MNKNKLILIVFCLFFITLFSIQVNAQSSVRYTIHNIDQWSNDNVDTKPNSAVKIINEDRSPTLADIIDGMVKKRKITIILAPVNNSNHSWAVRVVAINLTSYLVNNSENKSYINNYIEIYDPSSHAYRNTTVATTTNSANSTAYVFLAGQWIEVIAITMIYKSAYIPNPKGWNSVLRKDILMLSMVLFNRDISYEKIYRRLI